MVTWKKKSQWKNNYGRKFEFKGVKIPSVNIPSVNKPLYIFLFLVFAVSILSYLTYIRGNYIGILEQDKTNLEGQLGDCNIETQSLTSNLNECNRCLEGNKTSLEICSTERKSLSSTLSSCKGDLNLLEDDITSWRLDYDSCVDDLGYCEDEIDEQDEDLDECRSDLSDLESDHNAMKNNYAEDYCCLLQNTDPSITHYSASDTSVSCGSSGTELSC